MNFYFTFCLFFCLYNAAVPMLPFTKAIPSSFTKLKTSQGSTLYQIEGTNYPTAPLAVDLKGTRKQIGYDYAALLHQQTLYTLDSFLGSVYPKKEDQELINLFVDYCWNHFLVKQTPQIYIDELEGMDEWHKANDPSNTNVTTRVVSQRFYTLANMPADPQNIISMLEEEEEQNWPWWLKEGVNDIIKLLERIIHSCDAYGVWGSRTKDSLLFSSRNLDYNPDTGINKYKLVAFYTIIDENNKKLPGGTYTTLGFSFGLGALAGMNQAGVTVSEMNLDNSKVTFNGLAFPLRLRYVLEQGFDLQSSMTVWNSTNNTNSFNFLIGSATDALKGKNAAYALETILDFTAQFPANSPIEANAVYDCPGTTCKSWTSKTGVVHIGKPLPEAVWRANSGFSPRVMKTQEPLFNNTMFRYDLMHTLFDELQNQNETIEDDQAIGIVATLGTKGRNYYTCDQPLIGDNTMSISYAPGKRGNFKNGYLYVAWESGSGKTWKPAACSPYVFIDLSQWI